jgi:hypothetical protein
VLDGSPTNLFNYAFGAYIDTSADGFVDDSLSANHYLSINDNGDGTYSILDSEGKYLYDYLDGDGDFTFGASQYDYLSRW